MTPKICVIIPAYNASQTIYEVITGALKHCPDIIVADDGSDDDTFAVAEKAGAKLIKINQNKGKGNALKLLFRTAVEHGYDAVISIDADGQHDPDAILLFIEAHKKNPDRIIVGSRMSEKDMIPKDRINSMQIANFYTSLASNQFLEDTQCGFRLYPLSLINRLKLTTEKYVTETEILIKAGDMGSKINFVNVKAIYIANRSHFRPVKDFALVTTYIIFYLTVKWLKEGVLPDRPNTYTPNNNIDRIGQNTIMNITIQTITVFTMLPFTIFFLIEYILLSPFMNNFTSVQRLGYGYFKITIATFMLPFILFFMIIDNLLKKLSLRINFIDKLIRKFYPEL